jgi:DNA-binding transcriptional MerR regulator
MSDNLLTVSAAAKILDRSGQAVRGYERDGKLRAIRTTGGVRLFREGDVLKLAEKLRDKDHQAEGA